MADETVALCACGCGLPAPISNQTDTRRGRVKGQPFKWRQGHSLRKRPLKPMVKGYRAIKRNGETRFIHRLRAEAALGHPLPVGAVVHHPDEDPWNPDARLVICQDEAFHNFLHSRMVVQKAGGNPNTQRVCGRCHEVKLFAEFPPFKAGFAGRFPYCRVCKVAYDREYRETHLAAIKAQKAARYRAYRLAQQKAVIDTNEPDGDT